MTLPSRCRAYGQQQLSLFNAHHDSRCFMPIHIYEATIGKPVAVFLRPGKTPDGIEVAMVLRHVARAIRATPPHILCASRSAPNVLRRNGR